MRKQVGEAEAAAIAAEVRSAATERRPPRVEASALSDWVIVVERMFQAGELDAVEHAVRHLYAAYPRLSFVRNTCCVFDRLPPDDGQPSFHDIPGKEVQIVERRGADAVILLFCGFGGRLGLPLPVMHRWFGRLPAHLVYLRDSRRKFFMRGIRSLGKDHQKTLVELRKIIRRLGARRVLCYANSGGVFAALHYGAALPADAIVCMAGQTNVSPDFDTDAKRFKFERRTSLAREGLELDARRIYQGAERPPRTLFLFGANNWDDRIQAENLRDLPTVTLQAVPNTERHNIILDLVERGEFETVLDWLMEARGQPAFAAAPAWRSSLTRLGLSRLGMLLFGERRNS